jgi:hypothetical protein
VRTVELRLRPIGHLQSLMPSDRREAAAIDPALFARAEIDRTNRAAPLKIQCARAKR